MDTIESRKAVQDTLIEFALMNKANLKKTILLLCNWIPIEKLINNIFLKLVVDRDIKVK